MRLVKFIVVGAAERKIALMKFIFIPRAGGNFTFGHLLPGNLWSFVNEVTASWNFPEFSTVYVYRVREKLYIMIFFYVHWQLVVKVQFNYFPADRY